MSAQAFEQGPRWNGDVGPSWHDVSVYADHIWTRYGYRVELKLVQSVRRLDGKGNSAWQAVASASPREGRSGAPAVTTASWGSGGAAKTCPQAIYSALAALDDLLTQRENTAAQQAAF